MIWGKFFNLPESLFSLIKWKFSLFHLNVCRNSGKIPLCAQVAFSVIQWKRQLFLIPWGCGQRQFQGCGKLVFVVIQFWVTDPIKCHLFSLSFFQTCLSREPDCELREARDWWRPNCEFIARNREHSTNLQNWMNLNFSCSPLDDLRNFENAKESFHFRWATLTKRPISVFRSSKEL